MVRVGDILTIREQATDDTGGRRVIYKQSKTKKLMKQGQNNLYRERPFATSESITTS